ncbi:MAG TPA: hypothetical protein PLU35_12940 [Phycisphaerales bacterium]|nr:hypothetical protein [Phycisphaerales bacterium]
MFATTQWIARLCGVMLLIAAVAKAGNGDWLIQWLAPGAEADAASSGLGWVVVSTESVLGVALAVSPNRFAAAGAVAFGSLACSYAVLRHFTAVSDCPCLGALGENLPQAAKGLPTLIAGVGFVTTGAMYVFRANPEVDPRSQVNQGEESCEPAH